MADFKTTTVVRFAGQQLPDKFLDALFLNRSSAVGFAAVKDGSMCHVRVPSKELPDWHKAVKEVDEGFKDVDLLMAFSEISTPEFDEGNIQPIPFVVNEKNEPLVVGVVENASSKENKNENRSHALHVVETYLGPKFATKFQEAGKDAAKFESLVHNESFTGELSWLNATTTIMGPSGKTMFFSDPANKVGGDFEWGFTTDHFGFTEGLVKEEEPIKTPAETPAKPLSLLDKMKAGAAVNAVGKAAPSSQPKMTDAMKNKMAQQSNVVPKIEQAKTTPVDLSKYKRGDKAPEGYKWAKPNIGSSTVDKRSWYVAHDPSGKGKFPTDYKNSPEILIKEGAPTGGTALGEKITAAINAPNPAAKDTAVHNLPTVPPFMTHEAKVRFEDWKKKGRSMAIVDSSSKAIMGPEYIKQLENASPTFASETGVPWRAVYNWKDKDILELVGDRTEVFLLIRDLRNFALKADQAEFQRKPADATDVKEEPKKTLLPEAMQRRMAAGR